MLLEASQIHPSQDFLKPGTIRFIFRCLDEGKLDELPPTPLVRSDGRGGYVAIDGHNLIAVYEYYKRPIEVHVALSADDGLPPTSDENRQRNADLKAKYDRSLEDMTEVEAHGINSFEDLIIYNKELFDRD